MATSGFTSGYYESNAGGPFKLHYVSRFHACQTKPLILFLHGFPENSLAWHRILPYFYHRGFDVIALDIRGSFLSHKPLGHRYYQFDYLLEDIRQLLHLHPHDQVFLVGHDFGGALAWAFAEKYPLHCQGLVAINSPHHGAHGNMFKSNPLLTVRQTFRFWYMYFFQCPYLPELVMRRLNFFWLDYIFRRWIGTQKINLSRQLQMYKRIFKTKNAIEGAIAPYRANVFGHYGRTILKSFIKNAINERISCPVLMLWGGNDFVLENALLKESVAFCVGSLKVITIDKAGHWLHHEYPEDTIHAIEQFLFKTLAISPVEELTPTLSKQVVNEVDLLRQDYEGWLKNIERAACY